MAVRLKIQYRPLLWVRILPNKCHSLRHDSASQRVSLTQRSNLTRCQRVRTSHPTAPWQRPAWKRSCYINNSLTTTRQSTIYTADTTQVETIIIPGSWAVISDFYYHGTEARRLMLVQVFILRPIYIDWYFFVVVCLFDPALITIRQCN